MADSKITALTAISTVDPTADPLVIVDVSDTSMAASGTTKKSTINQLLGAGGTATLASATITGNLTVDTNTLFVDSTNNRVGILTASPRSGFALDVLGNVALGNSTTTTSNRLKLDCSGTAGNVAIMSFAAAGTNKAFFGLSGGFLGDASTDALIATDAAGAAIRFCVSDTGTEAMRLNSTGLGVGVTPSAARLEVGGQDGTQFYIRSTGTTPSKIRGFTNAAEAGVIGFLNGGGIYFDISGERMRINSSGNVGVGVTPASNTRTHFKGSSTSTDYITFCVNGSDKLVFGARNDGLLITGSSADSASLPNAPYNLTSGSAANVYLDSQGIFYRSTSSLKYKTDIADSTRGLSDVLKLRPVTYKAKNSGDTVFGGLIAEEVDAAGLTEFVQYAPDNTPDAIHYGNMVSLLVSAIKELSAEVNALKNA
jgi:hypothetical protein